MKIPISKSYFDKDDEKVFIDVLKSGWVMQGPKVEELEKKIASFVGTKYAVAVSSGTAALHLSMLALDIKNGDEVIVPSFSFIATANCVLYSGATPVFAEINPNTFNIDPRDIENKITKKTKAVIAVHQIGLPAEINIIKQICKKYKLYFIEDAACSLGAEYNGKKTGSFGQLACFSFHPRKSITTGEGGIITTNKKNLYENLKALRSHGMIKKDEKEIFATLGFNYRMSDIEAALGLSQFKKLKFILRKYRFLAEKYNEAFAKISSVQFPFVPSYMEHTYQSYMIKFKSKRNRERVEKYLRENNIGTKKITLIHKEPLYQRLFGKIVLPITEEVGEQSLIIPLYAEMTSDKQNHVIASIKNALL